MEKFKSQSLNEKTEQIKNRAQNTIALAFEKVVAHHEDPSAYPLPADGKSLEKALHNLLEKLPLLKRKKLIDKVNLTLKADINKRKQIYGDLAAIDLKLSAPIVERVKAMPVPESLKILTQEIDEVKSVFSKFVSKQRVNKTETVKPAARQVAGVASKLGFFLDELTCDKTGDIHKDEINIAGFAVDNLGNNIDLAPFFAGKFKKGDTIQLGAKSRLFQFDLTTAAFPASFTAGIFIIEKDMLSNRDLVDKLSIACVAIGVSLFAISTATLAVAALGGPWSEMLTVALMSAGLLFTVIGANILPFLEDDISFGAGDVLTLENKIRIGDVFDRPLQLGDGFTGYADLFDGRYFAKAKWLGE